MKKVICLTVCMMLVCGMVMVSTAYAAEKGSSGSKAKSFWQRLFNYPAKVTDESATVVTDAGKKGTTVVTNEVRRIGEVTSGDLAKTKELITEPITGTAEMTVTAVTETVKIPVEAAKEEPATTNEKNQ